MNYFIDGADIIEPPTPEEMKKIRIESGLTQNEVAKAVGLSSGIAISKYEQGNRRPSAQIWTLILLFIGKHPRLTLNGVKSRLDSTKKP